MSFELPLFPLDVVLFPHMPLPLHIFEPRYRLMISRCLEGDRTFGVILASSGEDAGAPALVGCAAVIGGAQTLADGRMNLHTTGMRRFRVSSVRELDAYLVGTCDWLDDAPWSQKPAHLDVHLLQRRVRWRLQCYLRAYALSSKLVQPGIEVTGPSEAEEFSLFVAALLTLPNGQKQQLLELTDTATRLELEEFLLERAEIVQRAYARRMAELPADLEDREPETVEGKRDPFAEFTFLN